MSGVDHKEFVLAGVVMKRLLSGEQNAGQFCLFENRSDGNTKTPIHVHAGDDETVYAIEGELTAVVDGRSRRLTAGKVLMPRGIPHQLMNMGGILLQIYPDRNACSVRQILGGRVPRASARPSCRPADGRRDRASAQRHRQSSVSRCFRIGPHLSDAPLRSTENAPGTG